MDLNGIPLFRLLQGKLGYLSERQKIIAQNVANASTPGFTPSDLDPFDKQPGMNLRAGAKIMMQPAQSGGGAGQGGAGDGGKAGMATFDTSATGGAQPILPKTYTSFTAPDSETTLNGNQVVLEEQMLKMSESRSDYDAAIGYYQKSLGLLHLAIRKPGG